MVALRANDFRLSSPDDGVMFDFWGNGRPNKYSWPIDDDAAWLAVDVNGNGRIDDAGELFGNATLLQSGVRARHGFEALNEYDDNHDGLVDRRDSRFGELLLWRDTSRNGRVDRGEMKPAAALGVTAFETSYRETRRSDRWGNDYLYRSRVRFSGRPVMRFAVDVTLAAQSTTVAPE